MKKSFLDKLGFDAPYERFELLETEPGQPGFFTARHEEKHREESWGRVSSRLEKNRRVLERAFVGEVNPDLCLRPFTFCGEKGALAAFVSGMARGDAIGEYILKGAFS